ncbi:MAG: PDZ domain-containing protein [Oceanospirillaceae bacterium]|nr:PDZ domain-containing protein [Oceanospirillaceae bacterium]
MIAINDKPIRDRRTSMDQIAKYKPGDEISIDVIRNDQQLSLTVKIFERPRSRS